MKKIARLSLFSLLLALTSCTGDDVDSLYANIRAFFRYNAVATTQPLYTAVNNPGMFCTITFSSNQYLFTGSDGQTATANATAVQAYGSPQYICGFIVGTPAVADLSTGDALMAFDLVCPNCYDDKSLNLRLSFSGTRALSCNSSRGCGRVYDLDNGGRVSSSAGGRALFRYHASYSEGTNTLLIQN